MEPLEPYCTDEKKIWNKKEMVINKERILDLMTYQTKKKCYYLKLATYYCANRTVQC